MSELIKAYQYDDVTKLYIGETYVQKCPYTGELLLPSNVTTITPPDDIPKDSLFFDEKENKWVYKKNYLGKYIYVKKSGHKILNKTHVFDLPETFTDVEPPIDVDLLSYSYIRFDDNLQKWIIDKNELLRIIESATSFFIYKYYKSRKQMSDSIDYNINISLLVKEYNYTYDDIIKELNDVYEKIYNGEVTFVDYINSKPENERDIWEQIMKAKIRFEFVNECKKYYKNKLVKILDMSDSELFNIYDVFKYIIDKLEENITKPDQLINV